MTSRFAAFMRYAIVGQKNKFTWRIFFFNWGIRKSLSLYQ